MSDKYVNDENRENKDYGSPNCKRKNMIISIAVIFVLIPATVLISPHMGDRSFYISGALIIIFSMIPFIAGFEGRKPQARELVIIAVMCAIAVASRVALAMLPSFKPMVGIIIITAVAMGPSVGFLTGAISGFVSNIMFGQGLWTPWQMFAFGIAGFIAGILADRGWLKPERRLPVSLFGLAVVILLVGPILDTAAVFTMFSNVEMSTIFAIYAAGLPFNAAHGVSTFITLFFLCKPIYEKLDRIKVKYGMR